jgi:hypothetical protein
VSTYICAAFQLSSHRNMKKSTLALMSFAAISQVAFAQTVTDSIQTEASYTNDVYYSLENGKVTSIVNSDWHLAFTIGTFNVGIRANTATASNGNGSVTVYESPETDMTKWSTLNTASYDSWPVLDNSDEDWESGALNANAGDLGTHDYGWGEYDPSSHVVTGNRFFVVEINNGGSFIAKKLYISSKDLGNWFFKYADLDGSNEKSIEIASADYKNKNFAYLSLLTGNVSDREPETAAWDFVLTRYRGWQPQGQYYPVTGILTNVGVTTSEVRNKDEETTTLLDTPAFSSNISIIGSDWKQLNASMTGYDAADNLSYFIKAKNGAFWKVVFTAFGGSSNGKAVFNKTKLTPATGLAKVGAEVKNMTVYPNPSGEIMHVLFDVEGAASAITVTDLTGKVMLHEQVSGKGFNDHTINVSNLSKGIYLLSVTNGNSRSVQKISVN